MLENKINVEGQKRLLMNDVKKVAESLIDGSNYVDYLQVIRNMIEEYDPTVELTPSILLKKVQQAAEKVNCYMPDYEHFLPTNDTTDDVDYSECPLEAVGNLENACYDMLYALDNSTLTEVVNETAEVGYPFEHSLDEQLHAIIDWTEIVVKKYQQSPTVRKLEQLLAGTQDANEIAVLTECIKKLEAK